jgi:tetratricopeptide (TPR) repeat protein
MRQQLTAFLALLISMVLIASVHAEGDSHFGKANQEFAAGHFKEAINEYENLVRAGDWSATLFYNLGNTYFRTGDFGHAILNYERALALEPHHPEAQANLRIARDEARSLELQPTWAQRYLRFGTINEYTIAAAIAFWVAAFSFAASILARRRSGGRIILTTISVAVFTLLTAAIFSLDIAGKESARAVVIGKDAQARVATADNANTVLVLPPGSEIKILQQRGDWLYALLPNNLNGWIPANSAELVRL